MRTFRFLLLLIGLVCSAGAYAPARLGSADAVWDPEYQLTDSAFDEYTQWSGQHSVVADAAGRIHVVWTVEDYFLPVPFQVFYKRYNPATGWTQDTCISEDLLARNLYCRFPSIATDASGDVHVVWVARGTTAADSCVYYKRCTPVGNGNGGWQDTARVITSLPATESKLTPDITCSPNGHVHVVWSHTSEATNGIRYRESTDGGLTWLAEVAVFDTAANGATQANPTIACAQNNTVHIAWCGHPYWGEAYHLYYKKRIGTTWFAREVIVSSSADQYRPSIATSPLTNNPHIIWRRWWGVNNFQIAYSYWDNTWQTPVAISEPPTDSTQDNPQLAFTPDGAAHAVWRGWTSASPSLLQIRYADRTPSGTWSIPIDLTSAAVRPRDYPSVFAGPHDLHVVWQDDRGTYQNLYSRHGYTPYVDVACTRLLAPSGTLDTGTTVMPACSVHNYDTAAVTFSVRMRIGTAYNQTATVTGLAGRTSQLVTFPDWTAGPRGALAVTCSTEMGGDLRTGNDKQTGSVTVRVHDVGCAVLLAPSGTIDSPTVVTPACTVANYGTVTETYKVRMKVGAFYSDSATVTAQAAGARTYVTFPAWTANQVGGPYVVSCSTALAGDAGTSNDKAAGSVTVVRPAVHDVGATMVLAPTGTIDTGHSVAPACTVANYGNQTESYRVRMKVGGFYNDTARVAGHAVGTMVYVTFPAYSSWPRGTFSVTCSTELAGDGTPANDKATGSVTVRVRDVGATAIIAPADTVDSGTVVAPLAAIKNFGTTQETFLARFIIGGAYLDTMTVVVDAGSTDTFTLKDWTAEPVGMAAVSCSTELASDMNRANDAVHDSVMVMPFTGIAEHGVLPAVFSLDKAIPNPTRGNTVIRFGVPRTSRVNLSIYSSTGALVTTLCDDVLRAGYHVLNCNLQTATCKLPASGVYLYRLQAEGFSATGKMMLTR